MIDAPPDTPRTHGLCGATIRHVYSPPYAVPVIEQCDLPAGHDGEHQTLFTTSEEEEGINE